MSGGWSGAFNELTTGADTAPTPQVNSNPPAQEAPKTWSAPDVSQPGHLHVNTSHLTTAADVIKSHLPELDAAVQNVQQQMNAFGSLSGWQAGEQIRQNLEQLVSACAELGQQTSDTHAQTASTMHATAATYDETENTNTQAAKSAGASSAPPGNTSGQASGSWS